MKQIEGVKPRPFALNAIAAGVAIAFGSLSAAVLAQEEEADEESGSAEESDLSASEATSLGTTKVTGTRILSQTITASSPVMEISGEEFTYSGATIVEDLVNQYPQLSPVFDNFQNNPSLGYSEVDLRGLGAQRTLTLVNGRRIPKGPGETPDISIIPAALIERVDVLTGGASAVYGSDAVAGVVNFILDNEFTGVSLSGGASAYQHDNDNGYLQGLMDESGYDYPTGDSGFGGQSRNLELAIGGVFGDGGHATAWATWRKNKPLFQGERDYSSCALNNSGTACGGSATADPANFYIYSFDAGALGDFSALNFYGYAAPVDGVWSTDNFYLFNYAPINYYQRPDERYTLGVSIDYEVREYAKPYLEAMFVNRNSGTLLAPSGTFFAEVDVGCDFSHIGTLCSDLGIPSDSELAVLVAKRNTEGGPRVYNSDSNNFSLTSGIGGTIWAGWAYDASLTYSRSVTSTQGLNDFLTDRIVSALLDGSYEVWTDSITPEQAEALQGVSMQDWTTTMTVFNAYATGSLGFGLPTALGEQISVAVGYEQRRESFAYAADTNLASGNFAGSGSENPQIDVDYDVEELFLEAYVPIIADQGPLSRLELELGYRYSDYSTSGGVDTYKIGLGANLFDDRYRVRTSFNRAIRAASLNELYTPQQLGLWSGEDPCAGSDPEYTVEQCERTGVTAAQYGSVPTNPANQYNQIFGGNPELEPEEADTWTIGFAAAPIKNLQFSLDYYQIELSKQIGTLSARTIIDLCAINNDAGSCAQINRASSGGLARVNDAYVFNPIDNFGDLNTSGFDGTASYVWNLGNYGSLFTSYVGTYVLEKEYAPVPGDDSATYDCAGVVSPECQTADYRHIVSARYSIDRYTVGLRWRYMGALSYESPYDGSPLYVDRLTCSPSDSPESAECTGSQEIEAYNWFDLSGSVVYGPARLTAGINNVFDKEPPMVGGTLVLNGNSIGGYDQAGRFFFTSLELTF